MRKTDQHTSCRSGQKEKFMNSKCARGNRHHSCCYGQNENIHRMSSGWKELRPGREDEMGSLVKIIIINVE